jgi:hypothetical protein
VQFVYRSHYEGPLSRRLRSLPDQTVLGWFQRGWTVEDPRAWVEAELDGPVYGLASIFEEASEHGLPVPGTTDELRRLLHEHLYVEGDADYIRLDDHSLRVRTDDDEVELAYFFLDDHVIAARPARLAYLLRDTWPLPEEAGERQDFQPEVPVSVAAPAGEDKETTYVVLLTFYDGESLAITAPLAFPGTALPALAGRLTTVDPAVAAAWPPELRVLRALVTPGAPALDVALERANRWPGFSLGADSPWPGLPDEHAAAHRLAMDLVDGARLVGGRRPEASLLRVGDHIAELAMHCDGFFGYQQWYLFDTIWAANHPDLAQSVLRYANHWDPLAD